MNDEKKTVLFRVSKIMSFWGQCTIWYVALKSLKKTCTVGLCELSCVLFHLENVKEQEKLDRAKVRKEEEEREREREKERERDREKDGRGEGEREREREKESSRGMAVASGRVNDHLAHR
jgi:hypothetical protein